MSGTNFGIFRPNNATGGGAGAVAQEDRAPNQPLVDFIRQLEDYTPTIPDAVTAHYLQMGGLNCNDPRIVRFLGLAAQKYISDVTNDAMQQCKVRTAKQNMSAAKSAQTVKEQKFTLTMDDLQPALEDYGILTFKSPYFP